MTNAERRDASTLLNLFQLLTERLRMSQELLSKLADGELMSDDERLALRRSLDGTMGQTQQWADVVTTLRATLGLPRKG